MITNSGLYLVKFARYAEPTPSPRDANSSPPVQQNAAANAGTTDNTLNNFSFIL